MHGSPLLLLDLAASRVADRHREAATWRLARAARAPAPSLRRRLATALRRLADWLAPQPDRERGRDRDVGLVPDIDMAELGGRSA